MKRNILDTNTDYSINERMPVEVVDLGCMASCIDRYTFASKFTAGKNVVDAACGDGYGSKYLENAKSYLGIDYSPETVKLAKKLYGKDFKVLNLETDEIPKCEVLISFETIEHLEDPLDFFRKVKESTSEYFIFSVPNNENMGQNPHHKWIFNEKDFKEIVSQYFECEFLRQEVIGETSVIEEGCYPLFLIGVCKL